MSTTLLIRLWPCLAEEGPPHNKRFQVGVFHREASLGDGWGRSKKEAEQEAARVALERLMNT
jgi:ribonuclease-3